MHGREGVTAISTQENCSEAEAPAIGSPWSFAYSGVCTRSAVLGSSPALQGTQAASAQSECRWAFPVHRPLSQSKTAE